MSSILTRLKITFGKSLADAAVKAGFNPLFQNNVTFVVILWGGLTSNFIYTIILSLKNRSYNDFANKSTPNFSNLLFSALAGTTWFLQFFFYGMGESKLGNGASSWILHMSTIILTANLWGIYRNEWKNVTLKTKWTITSGSPASTSMNRPGSTTTTIVTMIPPLEDIYEQIR